MTRYILALAILLSATPAVADKPSAMFCWTVRGAIAAAGSEKAAEDAARAKHVSEATIAKAKRCLR